MRARLPPLQRNKLPTRWLTERHQSRSVVERGICVAPFSIEHVQPVKTTPESSSAMPTPDHPQRRRWSTCHLFFCLCQVAECLCVVFCLFLYLLRACHVTVRVDEGIRRRKMSRRKQSNPKPLKSRWLLFCAWCFIPVGSWSPPVRTLIVVVYRWPWVIVVSYLAMFDNKPVSRPSKVRHWFV